ncbi:4-hydroxy-tetrahydrodipicolinate synthase [Aquimarina rhabdastrellae]
MNTLRGTGIALVTPFHTDGTIDFEGLTSLIDYCIEGKVDYLVVLGTTAESATLTSSEKQEVVKHIVKVNDKRLPLVLGIGGNNTAAVINEIETTDLTDFDAVLSVVPMYNKPSQEGIYNHYKEIAAASTKPILLYNVPSRTAVNMTAATTLRLAALDNIIGVKEATGDFSQVLNVLKGKPEGFLVLSGDDALALPLVTAGGDGVISVIGQGFPHEFSQIIRKGLENQTTEAYQELYKLLPAIDYAFEEGNPVGIKSILKTKGICGDAVRLPLIAASAQLTSKIEAYIKQ